MSLKATLPFVLLGAICVLLYGHTLHVPVYLDDVSAILRNPAVTDLGRAFGDFFGRRGLSHLTFALNHRFAGQNLAGYHVVNIMIHFGASAIALLLLRRIFPRAYWLSIFGALLFLAHPLQTQGVTYLTQRMTSLSAMFLLLSVWLFAGSRDRLLATGNPRDRSHLLWYGAALASGGLAILAKENAVILPLALLVYCRFLEPEPVKDGKRLLTGILPFAALSLAATAFFLLLPMLAGTPLNTTAASGLLRSMEGNSPLHYLFTQFQVLWIYIRMLVLPYGQALDHAYPICQRLLNLPSLAGLLGLAGLLTASWRLRQKYPLITGGVFWFFLTLLIESSIIPLDPLFEHRLYLPMFGFVVIATASLEKMPSHQVRMAVAVAVLLVFAVLTWQRNALWADPFAFYRNELAVAPHNERVMTNLGGIYRRLGRYEEAEKLLRSSIERNPKAGVTYGALKEIYFAQGRIDEAIALLRYARMNVPDNPMILNDLAEAYRRKGDYPSAITAQLRALEITPNDPHAAYSLARLYLTVDARDAAKQTLRKTLAIDPAHGEARLLLYRLERP